MTNVYFNYYPHGNMSHNFQMSVQGYDKAIKERNNIVLIQTIDAKLETRHYFQLCVHSPRREDDSRRKCNQAGPYEVFVDLHPGPPAFCL